MKKKEIIVFNKIDMINNDEIEKKTIFFKQKVKKSIYKISVIQNKGLTNIKKLMVDSVYK